jgi:hypothetical protein
MPSASTINASSVNPFTVVRLPPCSVQAAQRARLWTHSSKQDQGSAC